MSGRVRLWAPVTVPGDYLTLEFVEFYPHAGDDPAELIRDDAGRVHRVFPDGAERYILELALYWLDLDLTLLNNTDATTRRRIPDWFRYYCLANDSELIAYTEEDGIAVEPDGSAGDAFTERFAYKCTLKNLPDSVLGTRNRLGGGGEGIQVITFDVHDQGTFTSFDELYTHAPVWEGR